MGSSATIQNKNSNILNANIQNKMSKIDDVLKRVKKLQSDRLDLQTSTSLLSWIEDVEKESPGLMQRKDEGDEVEQPQSNGLANCEKIKKFRKDKEGLLNSLSEVAGNRIKDNNPGIADLSDTNRPSKLAERYSELYDNEWTDLVEELRKDYNKTKDEKEEDIEKHCIAFIFDTLRIVYDRCKETVTKQQKLITCQMLMLPDADTKEPDTNQDQDIVKRCKDFYKLHTAKAEVMKQIKGETLSHVKQCMNGKEYSSQLNMQVKSHCFEVFVDICTELCWFMRANDPPIHMVLDVSESNEPFQTLFRPYTRSGDDFDFMVWPALKLHKDGGLLYKGIAQFKKYNF